MFKELVVLALTGFCLTKATGVYPYAETFTADADFLHKQKQIYELFFYIDQAKLVGSEFYEVGRTYDIESSIEYYSDPSIVHEFLYRFKLGYLPRGSLFSVYYKEHRDELSVFFRLLYSAKDFATYYKTLSWARFYINEGMFVTALVTSVMYRPDCKGIILPPMYEVYPHLFFDNEVIQYAQKIKMSSGYKKPISHDSFNVETYFIDYNYTSLFMKHYIDGEYELDYFTDDVALNNYYYYIRNLFPFWMNIKDFAVPKHIRGELYYYIHQQLMARYYLERLSHGFGEIEDFSYSKDFAPSFYSTLAYSNGVALPSRERWSEVPSYKYNYVREIENIEMRIYEAIDSGYLYDYEGKKFSLYSAEGFNYLGNLIEGNYDSYNVNFYGAIDALYRDIFGFNYDCKHKLCVVPSSLQLYSTSLRDPAFYRLYKRIISYFYRYKGKLPAYTHAELDFPGVKIENVYVDKLYTYMEKYNYFINNALTVDSYKEGMGYNVKAAKWRLNYKPFTYKFDIKSASNTKGMVRIFLGPSLDDYYYKESNYMYYSWYNFVELDKFIVDLKAGSNTFERHSTESIYTAKDFVGGDYFYKKLLKSIEGSEPFSYSSKVYGFPENLYLPRGRAGGMPFKLFIHISPVEESKISYFDFPIFGKMLYDGKPFAYPLDRPMEPYVFGDLYNIYFKDVSIYYLKDGIESFYPEKYVADKYVAGEYHGKYEHVAKPYYEKPYYYGKYHY
ncbi:hexamerin-like [Aphidius gifuensis]|uniref:hexamerin-like n=1 Tax=Aphidius gifuensis TaxID=684658 RepID=UPI001CDBE098|nr:hexamerin-like [Aphidius gifuensis]